MQTRTAFLALSFALMTAPGIAQAKSNCPAAVTAAVAKAYPDARTSSCKEEKEEGKTQYEVKIDTKDARKLELDVSPDGSILQTEEKVGVDTLPKAVQAAFEAKYPKVKGSKADKQTKADGKVTYELAFEDKGKKHEATFADDGTFVEEE
jgi:uncharacterized membrane protein YkoI